jgi:hypothetical protein
MGDTAFQGMKGFGEAFPLQPEGVLVFFEIPVDSRETDG